MEIKSYRDLLVWQKSVVLVIEIYKLTESFPKTEVFGIISQMRRAAVSIPSNIAEGRSRGTRKDFRHFLLNAFGSGAELETQIEISKRIKFVDISKYKIADDLLNEVMPMLNSLISKLSPIT